MGHGNPHSTPTLLLLFSLISGFPSSLLQLVLLLSPSFPFFCSPKIFALSAFLPPKVPPLTALLVCHWKLIFLVWFLIASGFVCFHKRKKCHFGGYPWLGGMAGIWVLDVISISKWICMESKLETNLSSKNQIFGYLIWWGLCWCCIFQLSCNTILFLLVDRWVDFDSCLFVHLVKNLLIEFRNW